MLEQWSVYQQLQLLQVVHMTCWRVLLNLFCDMAPCNRPGQVPQPCPLANRLISTPKTSARFKYVDVVVILCQRIKSWWDETKVLRLNSFVSSMQVNHFILSLRLTGVWLPQRHGYAAQSLSSALAQIQCLDISVLWYLAAWLRLDVWKSTMRQVDREERVALRRGESQIQKPKQRLSRGGASYTMRQLFASWLQFGEFSRAGLWCKLWTVQCSAVNCDESHWWVSLISHVSCCSGVHVPWATDPEPKEMDNGVAHSLPHSKWQLHWFFIQRQPGWGHCGWICAEGTVQGNFIKSKVQTRLDADAGKAKTVGVMGQFHDSQPGHLDCFSLDKLCDFVTIAKIKIR